MINIAGRSTQSFEYVQTRHTLNPILPVMLMQYFLYFCVSLNSANDVKEALGYFLSVDEYADVCAIG